MNQRSSSSPKKSTTERLVLYITSIFLLVTVFFSYNLLEKDLYNYQGEVLYYRLAKDGAEPADQELHAYRDGIKRNLQYKDATTMEFFWSQWGGKVALYFGFLILPMVIALVQLRKRSRFLIIFIVAGAAACGFMIFTALSRWGII